MLPLSPLNTAKNTVKMALIGRASVQLTARTTIDTGLPHWQDLLSPARIAPCTTDGTEIGVQES
ncbi:hypothetical protein [Paraburkholderia dinghuensis]|nr:hypothetical protein [Paraburkholderia dinghuensis]